MITLVGVGHVFDISVQVRNVIVERKPDVVCVELDKQRYQGLLSKSNEGGQGDQGSQGKVPLVYLLLAKFQQRVASMYGGDVGAEMLAAVNAGREVGASIAFVDMNAQQLFHQIRAAMSFEEKVKMLVGVVVGGFFGLFMKKEDIDREIADFERNPEKHLGDLERELPVIKKMLIDDRNVYMSNAIKHVHGQSENIVAVVGDGHILGMKPMLEEMGFELEVIRLSQLRSMPKEAIDASANTSSVSISFNAG